MKYGLVVSCLAMTLLLVGCGPKAGNPGGGGGGGKDRTIHIYKIDDSKCSVDAKILVLEERSRQDTVKWESEDVRYTVVFSQPPGSPFSNPGPIDVKANGVTNSHKPSESAKGYYPYDVKFTDSGQICQHAKPENPEDDPGLNVKH
jgi:hypothetical protein